MTGEDPPDLRKFRRADTVAEVYSATVDAAAGLLGSTANEVAVAAGGELLVRARSGPAADASPRAYPLEVSVPGGVYSTGRPCLVADQLDTRSAGRDGSGADAPAHRAILCVPVGDEAVLVAKAPTPGSLTATDRAVAELLGSRAEAALDRLGATSGPPVANGGDRPGGPDRLEEVAQILSHDLKGPLSVARGSLELARSDGGEEHWERTATALARVEELVDSVVTLARTGERVESTETVELAAAVERARETVRADEATVVVAGSAPVLADPQGLSQLLENLVGNAMTHAGPAVTVEVGTTADGFYVEDDGPGIPAERREAVFERGYSSADGHSGLGLSIARRLAEAHGWTLTLADGEEGGARFEVAGVEFPDR